MKRIMFIGAMAALLFACGGEDSNGDKTIGSPLKISGNFTPETGVSYSSIANIKAVVRSNQNTSYDVATAPWNGGNFSITLPALKTKYLGSALINEFSDELTISDSNTKGAVGTLSLRNAQNREIGSLLNWYYYQNINLATMTIQLETIDVEYLFVDRDVTITGSLDLSSENIDEGTMTYNLRLKKGWNITYSKITMTSSAGRIVGTASMTTTKPSANYTWTASMDSASSAIPPHIPQSIKEKIKLF